MTTINTTTMFSNATSVDDCESARIVGYLSAVIIFAVSLALGTEITKQSLLSVWKAQKIAVAIGFFGQFGIMPLLAYAICQVLDYPVYVAIGCILCGTAPGGTTSNLATYFGKGNLPLSIVMTTISTVCSFFMIPLLVLLYISTSYSTSVTMDFRQLFISLALIIIPIAIGAFIRYKNKTKKWKGDFMYIWVQKIGSAIGGVCLLVLVLVGVSLDPEIISQGADLWVPAFLFQPVGYIFGYVVSHFVGLDRKSKRTVAIEIGLQNYAFSIAVVVLSFGDDCVTLREALRFPYIATIAYCVNTVAIVCIFRYFVAPYDAPEDPHKEDKEVDEEYNKTVEAAQENNTVVKLTYI